MTQKAVFFDLDGTIAANDQPPAPKDIAAIRALRSQGHLAFLCTGRVPVHIYNSVREVGFDGIVAAAGAQVSLGEQVIFKKMIEPLLLRRIIAHYLHIGQTCILEGEQSLYAINPRPGYECQLPRVTGEDSFCAGNVFAGQGVFKFTAYGSMLEQTRHVFESELYIIDHQVHVEMLPIGCCKADGMRRMLEVAGVDRENSVAFGDSCNDLDMLRYAGVGIAMGGAPEVVCQAADMVTAPLKQNGVAQALKQIIC